MLGVHIGGEDACSADMDKLTLAVVQARAAVEGLQDPAVELTLQWCCLNNSKASHLLRCNGDRVDAGSLLHFDEGMAAGLASALGDHLWTTVGRRPLFRLTQADLACEKRAPSLCRPSWQVGSPLAPWLLKCVNTLQMQVCALLRFPCRPTMPVLLQHGPCGCKGSRMLCMTTHG